MFDVPVDAMYVWVGVGVVSVAAFGVVVNLPSASPPDATDAARTVDAVAVGPAGSQGVYELDAARIRLGPHRLGLDGAGGSAHATFVYGPVTPVIDEGRLSQLLAGEDPDAVFDAREAFAESIEAASQREPAWRPAPDRLDIRRVTWGDVHATLVG